MTNLNKLKEVHDIFIKYNVVHTVTLICSGLERNIELIEYLKYPLFDIQIHCWEHTPMPENEDLTTDLLKCKETIIHFFGKEPTVLYPPWNMSNEKVINVANGLDLVVSNEKITLAAYLRTMGNVKEDVINFHYWAEQEAILVEPALRIYTKDLDKNKCE